MATNRAYAGRYENMEFPEYEYKEYPKFVTTRRTGEDGKPLRVIVKSKAEELKIIDEIVPVEDHDGVIQERDLLAKNLELAQKEALAKDEELAKLRAQLEGQKKPAEPVHKPLEESKTKPSAGVKI